MRAREIYESTDVGLIVPIASGVRAAGGFMPRLADLSSAPANEIFLRPEVLK